MRHCRSLPLILLAVAGAGRGYAQHDSTQTYRLDTVQLSAERTRRFGAGLTHTPLSPELRQRYVGRSLTELLSEQTPVVTRPYGPSGIAVMNVRGLSPNHSGVVWGGFVLNSPSTGQSDVALLPVALLGDVTLQWGGASAHYGSGLIGGSVLLSAPAVSSGVKLGLQSSVGEFGQRGLGVNAHVGGERTQVALLGWGEAAENDFPYTNTAQAGEPRQRRAHAATRAEGLRLDVAHAFAPTRRLSVHAWAQRHHRELPNSTLDTRDGTATLDDAFVRLSAAYQHSSGAVMWTARALLATEDQTYLAAPGAAPSRLELLTLGAEGEGQATLGSHYRLGWGVQLRHEQGQNTSYAVEVRQSRVGAFAMAAAEWPRVRADLTLRQEWDERADRRWAPLIPAVGVRLKAMSWLTLRGHLTRVFRLPTLNERYWLPGGSPSLRPETGVSAELGADATTHLLGGRLEAGLTGYDIRLSDWILWLPQPEGYWAPENRQSVRSLGLESRLSWSRTLGVWRVSVVGGYSYTRAAIVESSDPREAWRQLLYQPFHTAQGSLSIRRRGTELSYQHQGQGLRFATTTSDAQALAGFGQASLHLSQRWRWRRLEGMALLRIHNLTDELISPVPFQPLPGRHFSFTLTVNYSSR